MALVSHLLIVCIGIISSTTAKSRLSESAYISPDEQLRRLFELNDAGGERFRMASKEDDGENDSSSSYGAHAMRCGANNNGGNRYQEKIAAIDQTTASDDFKMFFVSIWRKNVEKCGGILIGPRLVLTAAHCFDIMPTYASRGSSTSKCKTETNNGRENYAASRGERLIAIQHYYWNGQYFKTYSGGESLYIGDLAVAVLGTAFDTTSMELPPFCLFDNDPGPEDECWVIGNGAIDESSNRADEVQMARAYLERCDEFFLCFGKGPLQGDSGGPVVCKFRHSKSNSRVYLAGIVSQIKYSRNKDEYISYAINMKARGLGKGNWLMKLVSHRREVLSGCYNFDF